MIEIKQAAMFRRLRKGVPINRRRWLAGLPARHGEGLSGYLYHCDLWTTPADLKRWHARMETAA